MRKPRNLSRTFRRLRHRADRRGLAMELLENRHLLAVLFSTGAGSAVTSVDHAATFDAGGGIDAATYTEDMLSVTTAEGQTAPQPGPFNPFTAIAPGTSGYFAVENMSFVSIRTTDAADMAAIEFLIGDLVGAGPGQPLDPFSTFLVWETYRDGQMTGSDRVAAAEGSFVGWSDSEGIDELRVGANGFPAFLAFGDAQGIAIDDLRVQLPGTSDGIFSTGAGSAVSLVNRTATFDGGGAIDVSSYSEDMLSVTTSQGVIAPQPGAFDPFTGLAPGTMGYYAVSNSSFVSIQAADDAVVTGIEFKVGDLFGAGPGQPPDPFNTFLVWETYRDGQMTAGDRILVADGTIVGWSDTGGIDELRVGASGFPSFTEFGMPQAIAMDDLKVELATTDSVTFTTGVGSAVEAADRMATFDAGGAIDVQSYSEDALSVTTTEGQIAPQPGAFDPFTGTGPGTSGYYAVSNSTFVSIMPTDAAQMTGIELMVGDLFGAGPGQPPDPFSTFLVWETYRDSEMTASGRVLVADGEVVGWSDPAGIDELRVGANGFSDFTRFGMGQAIAIDNLRVQLTVPEPDIFSIGSGSAVTTVDRMATFDLGGDIDVSNYEEDRLSVTTSEGQIATQPGAFNPFTGSAPGTSGYFAVSNMTFVSIQTADQAVMTGIEFMVGDLLGAGPGQPPDPASTFLVWETYRGNELTESGRVSVADGTIVGWSDLGGIDELRVGANGFPTYFEFGMGQAIALDDLKVQLAPNQVSSFRPELVEPTGTGFHAEFTEELDIGELALYDAEASFLTSADAELRGETQGLIPGSLVIDTASNGFRFVKSGGILAPDNYTIALRSSPSGIVSATGQLLDGDGDGTGGDDFTMTFAVAPSDEISIGVPDMVRGPGQAVNLPADSESGIPLSISDGANVRATEVAIHYDPALLEITAATVGADMPDGATVALDTSIAGRATVTFSSPADLPPGSGVLASLEATVPGTDASANYGRQQLLDVEIISVTDANSVPVPAIEDDSVHLVTFLGDVSVDGRINPIDASRIARIAALLASVVPDTPLTDPSLVADISGDGRINPLDAALVAQFSALLPVPRIPSLPSGIVITGLGARPALDKVIATPVVEMPTAITVEQSRAVPSSDAAEFPAPGRWHDLAIDAVMSEGDEDDWDFDMPIDTDLERATRPLHLSE